MFWITCILLSLLTVAVIIAPLWRAQAPAGESPDVALYRTQLSEIDRDLGRAVLDPDEADRARAEVARRLLAAANTPPPATDQTQLKGWLWPAVVAGVIIAASFATYLRIGAPGYGDLPLSTRLAASEAIRASRPGQAALEAAQPARPPIDAPAEYLEAVAELRALGPTRPDDTELWRLLSQAETRLRNYPAAAAAQAQRLAILGDAAVITERERLVDLLVVAAGGFVSPEAEAVARSILEDAADNTAARYYLGALYFQTDRPDLALRFWRGIIEGGDPGNFHVASARAQVEEAALRAGVDYALPEARGPSFAEMDAAAELAPEARAAMIGGMVNGLAERLATQGGPAEDWARLIRAYGVLGETARARAVWQEAQEVFVSSMRGMEILTNAARDAGLFGPEPGE